MRPQPKPDAGLSRLHCSYCGIKGSLGGHCSLCGKHWHHTHSPEECIRIMSQPLSERPTPNRDPHTGERLP